MDPDESYFSALFGYDNHGDSAISDEDYIWELHIQEALLSSFSSGNGTKRRAEDHRNVQVNILSKKIKIEPPAESSRSFCRTCMKEKPISDIFRGTNNCTHTYCTDCIERYVTTSIKENMARIKCPDGECMCELEPSKFQGLIPRVVLAQWEHALCESLVLSWEKVYCPFKDCSAVMADDGGDTASVTALECPSCHRLFCVQCKVMWHEGIGCEEYRRGEKEGDGEDATVKEMAEK